MKELKLLQFNKAIQLLVQNTTLSDSEVMEFSEVYPSFEAVVLKKQELPIGYIFSYGLNQLGDTQLYQVLQPIVPSNVYLPDVSISLYKQIGIIDGVSVWTQPLGNTDAYMIGDKVNYNDDIYTSIIDNNVWRPDVYGWEVG